MLCLNDFLIDFFCLLLPVLGAPTVWLRMDGRLARASFLWCAYKCCSGRVHFRLYQTNKSAGRKSIVSDANVLNTQISSWARDQSNGPVIDVYACPSRSTHISGQSAINGFHIECSSVSIANRTKSPSRDEALIECVCVCAFR